MENVWHHEYLIFFFILIWQKKSSLKQKYLLNSDLQKW